MDRFKGTYRIETLRLRGRDYTYHRWCFVTICTKDREEYFGQVVDGEMRYNDIGTIARRMYADIPRHNKGVTLDEFIVMPNHVHGIIVLGGNRCGTENDRENRSGKNHSDHDGDHCRDVACNVSTIRNNVGPIDPNISARMSAISPKAGSLGSVIRSFKSAVTNWCHANGRANFAWQSRYHDHIIRDHHELVRIRQYIVQNPVKWYFDENNPNRPADPEY